LGLRIFDVVQQGHVERVRLLEERPVPGALKYAQ
jgi:hypothetical protein